MARKQQAERWADYRQQRECEEEERRQRVMVITEFDAGDSEATMQALAGEILKYRLAVRLLARAIGWGRRWRIVRGAWPRSSLASEAYA